MIIAATGHRPPKLGGYGADVRRALEALAFEYLMRQRPTSVISGMALGWDQAFAIAACQYGIPFTAAVPFEGQHLRWPIESQRRFEWLLSKAAVVKIISDHLSNHTMQARNEWMVDQANKMCALWDGSFGGTFNCLRYAKKVQRPVDNLWSRWIFRDLL